MISSNPPNSFALEKKKLNHSCLATFIIMLPSGSHNNLWYFAAFSYTSCVRPSNLLPPIENRWINFLLTGKKRHSAVKRVATTATTSRTTFSPKLSAPARRRGDKDKCCDVLTRARIGDNQFGGWRNRHILYIHTHARANIPHGGDVSAALHFSNKI